MSGVNQIQEQNREMLALMTTERRTKETAPARAKDGGKTDVADA